MTTKTQIQQWFEGTDAIAKIMKPEGATHMLVVCDEYDYTDFPVWVQPGEDVREVVAEYEAKNLHHVMEVYAYHLPLDGQLNQMKAWCLESPSS